MSAGKHTAGPWSYRSQPHDDWGIVRAGRFIICQARDPDVYESADLDAHRRAKTDPWEANARLIAAAPELLAALAEFAVLGHGKCTIGKAAADMARAAIAKAQGRS